MLLKGGAQLRRTVREALKCSVCSTTETVQCFSFDWKQRLLCVDQIALSLYHSQSPGRINPYSLENQQVQRSGFNCYN